jgi:lipopolysaccharide transport system permease protein
MNQLLLTILKNKTLIYQMVKRDIQMRYRGSMLGLGWSILNPLVMLTVYTFVFSIVFTAKWGTNIEGGKSHFSIILFAGMIVFNMFAECFNRAPQIITSNGNYVSKIVFPVEILPITILGSALFHAFISLLILVVAILVLNNGVPLTLVMLPIIWGAYLISLMGLMLIISSVGVYFRDIGQITGVLTTILMFTSPLFFPLDALPKSIQPILNLNPLAHFIEQTRDVLIFGKLPTVISIITEYVLSLLFLNFGYVCFMKLKSGFADVI